MTTHLRTRPLQPGAMALRSHTPGQIRACAKTAHALGHRTIALACRGVSLVLSGQTLDQAGESIGVSRQRVHQWMRDYNSGGLSALTKDQLRQCESCKSVMDRSMIKSSVCVDCHFSRDKTPENVVRVCVNRKKTF